MLLAESKYKYELVLELRKQLHAKAEPSMQEVNTKALLIEFLHEHTALEIVDQGSWFYALHKGNGSKPSIALRADFDAVLCADGCARHLCGHDGHSAILAGLGLALEGVTTSRDVYLLFQPAEETGQGAGLCSSLLTEQHIEEIYGLHNLPGFAEKEVLLAYDTFACASTGMEIKLTGAPSHAAYPEQGRNPAILIAQLITYLQELLQKPHQGIVLGTVIGVDLGSRSYGVAAEKGALRLTLRAERPEEYAALVESMKNKALEGAAEQGLECAISFIEPFPATVNTSACVDKLKNAAAKIGLSTAFLKEPMRWSEDFGHYLQKTQGAFFGIGCGEQHTGLHTAAYEFNDDIIESAVKLYLQLIKM